jgi:hypothetical protein
LFGIAQFDFAPLGFVHQSGERPTWITAVQRYKSAFGHVDVGTREECRLKQGDGFSGLLPTAPANVTGWRTCRLPWRMTGRLSARPELRRIKSATSLHI